MSGLNFFPPPPEQPPRLRKDIASRLAQAHDPRELAAIYTALDRLLLGASDKLVERLVQREMRRPLY